MHRSRGARERDGASGRCGGGLSRGATTGMSDVQPGLPAGRDYIRVHHVDTAYPRLWPLVASYCSLFFRLLGKSGPL